MIVLLLLEKALLEFRESSLPVLSLTGIGWNCDAFSYGIPVGLCQALGAWYPGSVTFQGPTAMFET